LLDSKKIIFLFLILPFLGLTQELKLAEFEGFDSSRYTSSLDSAFGDLDGDGIAECALALNVPDTADFGFKRVLVVLKQKDSVWYLWKTSKSAILSSEDGGVMGDPFQGLDIENNKIFISHSGGSNWRWRFVDSYALVDTTFFLATHFSYWGSFCDEKIEIDFDLFSGQILYSLDLEECGEGFGDNSHLLDSLPKTESFIYKNVKIYLQNRLDTNIRIISPVNGFEIGL
jgi:hypothetical protein